MRATESQQGPGQRHGAATGFEIRQAVAPDAPQIAALYRLLVPGSPVNVLPERLSHRGPRVLRAIGLCPEQDRVREVQARLRPHPVQDAMIRIDLERQSLALIAGGETILEYPVSTGANGHGCEAGSYRTPIGWHRVRLKIGDGHPLGAVFAGRRPTGEVFSPALHRAAPTRDWILTRILWLEGLEPGLNRGQGVDTLRRYIYIHGTPDEGMENAPSSHGCIRMYNAHLVDLFARVDVGTRVLIATRQEH